MKNKISESELEISELLKDINNGIDNKDKEQSTDLSGEELNESNLDQDMNDESVYVTETSIDDLSVNNSQSSKNNVNSSKVQITNDKRSNSAANEAVVKEDEFSNENKSKKVKLNQVKQLNSKINFSLEQENKNLQKKLIRANNRIENMDRQINNQKKQIEKYKKRINDLELLLKGQYDTTSNKKDSKKETSKLKKILSHTENRKNNLEKELSNYIKEVNLLREDLRKAYLELAEVRGRLSKYEQIDTIVCSIENGLSKFKSGKVYISAIIKALRKH